MSPAAARPATRLGWLMGLLRPYTRPAAVSVLCGFAASASSLGLLATAAWLISAAALQPSIAELQVAIVGVRFFGLARGGFRYLERLATHSVNFRLLTSLRTWVYRRLEPLAPACLVDDPSGELFGRGMGSVNQLEQFYVRAAAPPLAALLMVALVSAGLAAWSVRLALIWLAGAALFGLALPGAALAFTSRPAQSLAEARTSLQAWLVDHLGGLAELAASNQVTRSLGTAAGLQRRLDRAQEKLALLQAGENGLTVLITSLAGACLLIAAVPLVNSGRLDRLLLAVVVIGGMAAYESLQGLPSAGRAVSDALEEAGHLRDLTNRSPAILESPGEGGVQAVPAGRLDLVVENLAFAYEPGLPAALDGLDLVVPAGRHAALLGASGAGKTSLVNLLARFWEYDQGFIRLGGADLRCLDPRQVRKAIRILPAHPHLFNASIRANLLAACPGASHADLHTALEIAYLDAFLRELPHGLDTPIGEGGLRLSAGEGQRLALARFLLQQGAIWVLDEPTAHLDAVTASQVRQRLLQAAAGCSVLWITHDLAGLDAMDWVYLIEGGKLVEEGSPGELLQRCGRFRRLQELAQDLDM